MNRSQWKENGWATQNARDDAHPEVVRVRRTGRLGPIVDPDLKCRNKAQGAESASMSVVLNWTATLNRWHSRDTVGVCSICFRPPRGRITSNLEVKKNSTRCAHVLLTMTVIFLAYSRDLLERQLLRCTGGLYSHESSSGSDRTVPSRRLH
jgi:hypothetical protein